MLGLGLSITQAALLKKLAAVAATAEIWLFWGDSLMSGVADREAQDTDWTGVYQVTNASPPVVTSDITPLSQIGGIPGSGSPLSPAEYFCKQRYALTGLPQYIVSYAQGGSRIQSGQWGVGNTYHEAFIARCNAAIAKVLQTVPGAVVAGIVQSEGTNSAIANLTEAAYSAALTPIPPDLRSRIFQNGVSGADISDSHYMILRQMPEYRASNPSFAIPIDDVHQRLAATLSKGHSFALGEGLNAAGDSLHPSQAGSRAAGIAMANIIDDVTPGTITTIGALSLFSGQKLLLEVTTSEPMWVSLSGPDAAQFEIVRQTDSTDNGNIASSRVRRYIRFVGDATKTFGSVGDANGDGVLSVTMTGTDRGHNVVTKNLDVTILAAYGTQVGTVAASHLFAYEVNPSPYVPNTVDTYLNSIRIPQVPVGAGMNVFVFKKTGGVANDFLAAKVGGVDAVIENSGGDGGFKAIYVPMGTARTVDIILTFDSGIQYLKMVGLCVTGVKATPVVAAYSAQNYNNTPPWKTPDLTCPTNGIIVGGGYILNGGAAIAGEMVLGIGSTTEVFTAFRTTSGGIGLESDPGLGNYSFPAAAALAFQKA